MCACACDCIKTDILQRARLAAKAFKRADALNFSQPALRGVVIKPMQKPHHGGPIAQMCSTGCVNLGGMFARLGQSARLGAFVNFCPCLGQNHPQLMGGCLRIKADGARVCLLAQPLLKAVERVKRDLIGQINIREFRRVGKYADAACA